MRWLLFSILCCKFSHKLCICSLYYCNKYFLNCTFVLIVLIKIFFKFLKCIAQTFSSVCCNIIHYTSISHFCSKPVWSTDFHFLNKRHHLHVSQSLDEPSYWSKQWFFFKSQCVNFMSISLFLKKSASPILYLSYF